MKRILFAVVALTCLFQSEALARDMGGKFGLGFSSQLISFQTGKTNLVTAPGTNQVVDPDAANRALSMGLQAISIRYGLTETLSLQSMAGFVVGEDDLWGVGGGVKVWYTLIGEENINFYLNWGGKIAAITGGDTLDILSLLGGPGVEFFFPGLESIGFYTEFGLEFFVYPKVLLSSTAGNVYFGMHYHF